MMYAAPRRLFPSAVVAIALLLTSSAIVEVTQPLSANARFSPPKPPNRGTPGIAKGGGSRSCMGLAKVFGVPMLDNLNALAPEYSNKNVINVWGYTTLEHPKFWFYMPYDPEKIASIELTLQNDQEETLQKISVPIPAKTGIIGVKLPSDKAGLAVGKLYNWYFKIYGKCAERPANVEGWIQRTTVDPALAEALKPAAPQEKAKLLAEKGIWYDALTILAEQRLAQPNNAPVLADWKDLLKDIDMELLADQPLVRSK